MAWSGLSIACLRTGLGRLALLAVLLLASRAVAGAGDPKPGRPATAAGSGSDRGLPVPRSGLSASLTRMILDELLGPAVDVAVEEGNLVISVDPTQLAAIPGEPARPAPTPNSAATRPAVAPDGLTQFQARPSYRPNDRKRPTICLVHGLHSNSTVFAHVVVALEQAGFGVVLCDYPDRRALAQTGPQFVRAWKAFRDGSGDTLPWAVLGHSMGGLVARYYIEGPEFAADVSDFILIGTPNRGAAIARMQPLVQLVEQLQGVSAERARRDEAINGQESAGAPSARDLLPSSAFLKMLNGRSRAAGVRYRILAGSGGFLSVDLRQEVEKRLGLDRGPTGSLLGGIARLALGDLPAQLDELTEGTGDGAVAIASTKLDGAPEPLVIPANHVELIRGPLLYPDPGPIACMPHVLRWLAPLRQPQADADSR